MSKCLNPLRTIDELKQLRALTGDENGAQRIAFTETWAKAREWYKNLYAGLAVDIHTDEAGNLWVTLAGESERALIIGGHIDSVPNGGWLDGCLNVLAGLEILRRIHSEYNGKPPITVRIVDADEGQKLNRDYRLKDYATNVLTFVYNQAPRVTADLVLCAPVIAQEARAQRKTLQAHYAHMIVHGTLHAQAWDHETGEADAAAMEAREIEILAGLGFKNPY